MSQLTRGCTLPTSTKLKLNCNPATHPMRLKKRKGKELLVFFFNNFIYLFLVVLGLRCYTQPFSSCGVQAAHCVVTSLVEHGRQQLWHMGWATSRHVGSSWTRDRTRGSCIGRWILYHWATREAPGITSLCPANTGDKSGTGSILGSGRSPRGGHGRPLEYSSLENPMDRRAWRVTVHRVRKSWTRLKQLSTHTCPAAP